MNPQALRKSRATQSADSVRLTLSYRPPLAWDALLAFLSARAAPAVECVSGGVYARTMRVDGHVGVVRVSRPRPRADEPLQLEVSISLLPVLLPVVARVRRLFDLDAEPDAIATHLSKAGLTIRERGLRVPGAADSFELAVRAILGQQVSVKGASTLMSRFMAAFGEPLVTDHALLTHLAATAERVAAASVMEIASLGMPRARATTIFELARRVASGELVIEAESDVRVLSRQLLDVPGIGPWTAEYIIMRAVHWPDAFPASDLVLRRVAGVSAAQLLRRAEEWRPWRAYAAMHLWRG